MPEVLKVEWKRWRNDVPSFVDLEVKRCFKPERFGAVKKLTASFSDASYDGYGQCPYLRLVNSVDKVHCSLVLGKSRVAP